MEPDRRRILVVVDGSRQSFEMVSYVAGVIPAARSDVLLLHIMSKVPDTFWDLETDPLWQQKVNTVREWETRQTRKIDEFMGRARQVLLDAGFPPDAVAADVRERREGIARDIRSESFKGYDCVVIGRRGLSTLEDLSLGGIAAKIIQKLYQVSVWLVGGTPELRGVLIGLDTSAGSMNAVDHVARMFDGSGLRVRLAHVVRSLPMGQFDPGIFSPEDALKRIEDASTAMEPVFREAAARLAASGISSDSISSRLITGVSSRAGALIEEARTGNFGTIVVGRRGLTRVEEFDMGRVTNKLAQAARDRAVWIVG